MKSVSWEKVKTQAQVHVLFWKRKNKIWSVWRKEHWPKVDTTGRKPFWRNQPRKAHAPQFGLRFCIRMMLLPFTGDPHALQHIGKDEDALCFDFGKTGKEYLILHLKATWNMKGLFWFAPNFLHKWKQQINPTMLSMTFVYLIGANWPYLTNVSLFRVFYSHVGRWCGRSRAETHLKVHHFLRHSGGDHR